MDYGMVGGKEAGTESRFKQWTSMMEGLPSVATQEANMHKNGERQTHTGVGLCWAWSCNTGPHSPTPNLRITLDRKIEALF